MFINSRTTSLGKYFSIITLIFTLMIISAGCQKKAEQPEGEKANKDTTNVMKPGQSDTTAMVDSTKMYPDLTGTWTGTFQNHNATLKITDQTKENFKAHLNVAYREPMIKTISGTINSETNKISMKDDQKSRYEASYMANLSKDMKKLSGTAHFKVDGNDVNFTFTKK